MADPVRIEVAYARADRAFRVSLQLEAGTTVRQAIQQSGLLEQCPEIDLTINRVGIFARLCEPDDPVSNGDRVEIYRPLQVDPKEARRRRAAGRGGQPE